ncbi:MAG: D-alanine--D-alanine ligase [Oscillospiraceae bacterium]|jgi:D-alanine-D-alanine ligase|nr:D-alanine--D-alanine ligase [Oscillospiraceae bacterium]
MKIIVLAGGLSPERDVSLSSGALIANALIDNGHDVLLLDLYLGTNNTDIEPAYKNKQTAHKFYYKVPEQEPDLTQLKQASANGDCLIGEGVLGLCKEADVVFLALHGSIGENGQLQALFDIDGIDYTGTGYAGSLLAMDKDLSKKIMKENGILTPGWYYMRLHEDYDISGVRFPCVVKPCSCGSSVGVAMVENTAQLKAALAAAEKYEDTLLIEDKIEGREFSVGILGDVALPSIEIIPKSGFYDYKNKYQAGLTEEVCPAIIPAETEASLQKKALAVHKALRLGFYSRVDFILDNNNNAFCLEANTLPGMTPTSLLPQEALAVGISYNALCERIALGK